MNAGRRLANSCTDIRARAAWRLLQVRPMRKSAAGRALVAGGGFDRKINERFALRFKADYFQTGSQFPNFAKKKQDNFRFSVGIVIRNVHKKKRTLEDETQVEP